MAKTSDGFDFPLGKPDGRGYKVWGGEWGLRFLEQNDYLGDNFPEYHPGEDWNDDNSGLDYGNDKDDAGDPVYAVSNGIVKYAQYYKKGWGYLVLIEHQAPVGGYFVLPDGTEVSIVWSLYGHLGSIAANIQQDSTVDRGQQIGTVGDYPSNSGQAFHLHFEIRVRYREPWAFVYNSAPDNPWPISEIQKYYTHPTNFINLNRPTTPDTFLFSYLFEQAFSRNGGATQVGNPQGIQAEIIAGIDCFVQKYIGGKFGENVIILNKEHRFPESYLIRTGFYEWWKNNKEGLGPPINDEYRYGAGSRQDFQKGYLTWDSQNGVRSFAYTAPGQYSDGFRIHSQAFVVAYNRNGAAVNVGKTFAPYSPNDPALVTVHNWEGYEIQDFKDGLTGWGWNAIIRHPDYETAYLIRTGFWETYKLKGGPAYFGAPLDDEYLNYSTAFGYGWPHQDFEKGYSMIWNPLPGLKKVYVIKNDNPIFSVLFGGGGGPGDNAPGATVLTPNGGEIWQAGTVQRIAWSATDDVGIQTVSLEYSVDDGLTWQSLTTFQGGQTTQYSWVVPNAVSSACRIRVIAYDAAGNIGLDQSDATFTISAAEGPLPAPTMYEPSVSGQNYTIFWPGVSGAQSYLLQEDTTPSFANPIEYNTNLTVRYFSNRADEVYYYRVSAVNSQGRGAWSNTKYAVVNSRQPPGEITNMLPPNGATNQPLSMTLSWSSVHPTGESVKYNVWFAPADVEFFYPARLISAQQAGTTYTVSNLPYNTTCSWRIEAIDETGDSRISPIFRFTTVRDNTPPSGSMTINNGAATTNTYSVSLQLSASDAESGVRWMRFSNDGNNWSQLFYYSLQFPNWNLTDREYGGRPNQTIYTVYAQFKDEQGNISTTYSDTIEKTTGTPGIILLRGVSYPTIRDAMAASTAGDTVCLTEGVYTIQGAVSPPRYPARNVGIVMNPGVTLIGAGADRTELILEGIGLYTVIDADNCAIQGLTIINSDAGGVRHAILAESNTSKISHCIVKGSLGGILVGGSSVEVSNNLIINNDEGIRDSGNSTRIYNNTIAYHLNGGILGGSATATIKNNIVVASPVQVPLSTVFYNNNIFERTNYSKQSSLLPDQTGINGNISADPLFVNTAAGDYRLSGSSSCIDAGTDVGIPANGFPDMGAFEYNGAGTIRVESNRSEVAFTITGPQTYTGSGIGWSVSGAPIGVYSISFSPVPNHNTPLYTSKILRSGETLVFNGYYASDVEPPDVSISINYGEYATAESIVDITLSASDKVAGLGPGAQMQFSNDSITWSPLESYSTLKQDWDLTLYGGVRSSGTKTVYAKVSDVLGNFTSAITDTILYVPNPRILEVPGQFSTIQAAVDSAQPGDIVWVTPGSYREDVVLKPGIRLQGSGPKLTTLSNVTNFAVQTSDNCVIDGFTLTGRYQIIGISNASPIISNSVIRGSTGIVITGDSHPVIRNCVITLCDFSGIVVEGHPDRRLAATVENCTISNNGTGIAAFLAQPNTIITIINSIIANNNYGIKDDNSSDTEHTHIFSSFNMFWNNIDGNFAGQNKDRISSVADEDSDPKFTDATNGDFSLRSDSPAINTGNPETKYTDIDGTPNNRGTYGGPAVNTPPVADFTTESQFGGLGSTFTFHASTSSDRETRMGGLNFRWDWDGDGLFDTPFSTNPQITHSYQTLGEKSITLQVRDAGGFVSSVTKQMTVLNQPPNAPADPQPEDGIRGQDINIAPPDTSLNQTGTLLLRWSAFDADVSDTLRYDLYFGSSPLAKIDSGLVDTSYTIAGLRRNTFYHWRVDAIDSHGARVEGAEWTLLTEPDPLPDAPENLNTSVLSYKTIQLGWGRKSAKALGYRIERKATSDTSFALINVVTADSTLYVDQANLLGNTPYAYRVSAVNSSGRSPYSNMATVTTYSDLLGDVNNDVRVNITDALVVATYDLDSTITAPNKGTITPLGDIDYNDRVTITDALVIATYDIAPENPNLPFGIAESIFRSMPALKPVSLPSQSIGEKIIVEVDAQEDSPKPGDIVTMILCIRMGDIPEKLGAYSARVQWNPSELNFVGYTGPERPTFDYSRITTNNAAQGQLRLNAFAVQGVGGDIELVHLQFRVLDELKSNPLKVELTSLTAAQTFHDLLPAAQVKMPNFTALPSAFALYQNYPNPFNPQTVIMFDVPQAAKIRIDVYNLLGQRIRVLLDKKVAAGRHQVFWDSQDERGREVGNGLYFVRMVAGKTVFVKKMLVLK